MMIRHIAICAFVITGAAFHAPCAVAQDAAAHFRTNRTINLYIGYAPGGSYDLYGRMVARHLGRHVPGEPAVVPSNMPGAGSLQAANFLYSVAPKDGTALGALGETLAMEQALRNPGVKYDASRLTWIGRIASSNNIHLVWHTSKAQSVEDALKYEMTVAGTGPANLAETVPKLLNALIGTKFKVISGYASSGPGMLAMERGEVDGAGTSWAAIKATKQDWLREKKVKVILQDLPERDPELPDVPALLEFGKTEEDKKLLNLYASGGAIGRAISGPPGLPASVTAALRQAFQDMVKDPQLKADLDKAKLDLEPATYQELEATVNRTVNVSDAIRERVRSIFGSP
ncbi:MAG: Bug family tripartite tricarboxylate transporter substrate binding protein [Beijerinckiaceae bacterium]